MNDTPSGTRKRRDANLLGRLHDAVAAVAAQPDVEGTRRAVASAGAALLATPWCGLALLDERTGRLRLVASHGPRPAWIPAITRPGEGLLGEVARTRQAQIVRADAAVSQSGPTAGAGTGLAVPVWHGERFVGVLAVADTAPGRSFRPRDRSLLTVFACQAATALESARLREELVGTERRHAEHTRQLRQEMDDFVSIVSHEFKTPLTSIKGFAQLVARRLRSQADESTLRALETIDLQASRLARMATDLTLYVRLESGKLQMHKRQADLVGIARSAVEALRPSAAKSDIVLVASEEELPLACDPDRVLQVIVNLLSNAIKYSPEGGEIRVTVQRTDGRAAVAVQDHGIGISAEQQRELFKGFYRADRAAALEEGTGLGLAIAKSIVEAHGGAIWAEGEPGRGSTFHFTLPLSQDLS